MPGELSIVKSLLSVLAIFLCIGLLLAREVLSRFGLESSYPLIVLCAATFTALLAGSSLSLMAVVLLLGLAMTLSAETLGGSGSAACCTARRRLAASGASSRGALRGACYITPLPGVRT
jgi:predicted histidine transporter YuiF (NhaC family)